MYKKITLIIAIAAVIFLFFHFDLDSYFTVENAKNYIAESKTLIADHLLLSMAIFFIVYVLVAALSLPGAVIMSLAAGALFGVLLGTVIVSFSSTIGATLAFLVARYIFRDFVHKHFKDRLKRIDDGMKREGVFYLFTLRMLPIFPFGLVNSLMGLTSIKTWTFYWVSQIGMLAGTAVYVNAGTQLAEIDSLANILSPNLIFSFALLAVFPWLAKFLINFFKKRRNEKNK